jgi:hypothetical protein
MRQRKRRWQFEQLESRRLLAVTVTNTSGGDLLIAGDATADTITITENAAGTQWQIAGSATLVNGVPSLTLVKPTVQDVFILLDGGADSLTMLGINQGTQTFVGDTNIDMGAAADTVNLGSFTEPGPLAFNSDIMIDVDGDEDLDLVEGSNANQFIGGVSVDLSGGVTLAVSADTGNALNVFNTDFGRVAGVEVALIRGQLNVHGSAGADTVTIRGSNAFGGSFDIDTGAGADVVTLGEDTEAAFAQDAVTLGGSLNLDVGDGDDTVTFESVLAVGNITVHGGAGNDTIRVGSEINTPLSSRVGSSTQGDMVIQAGDGNDTVSVNQATTVNSFLVGLGGALPSGAGNQLVLQNSSFSNDSAIFGGDGADNLDIDAVNIDTNLFIQTGAGADNIDIQGTLVTAGLLTIITDDGDDDLRVDNSVIVGLVIVTGDGNDDVELTANLIDDLFADLGAGNDTFRGESTYRNQAFVRGGAGTNTGEGSNFDAPNFFFEDF